MTTDPTTTIVIPTRDRPQSLARTLAALRRQETARSWELVVVDDGSTPALTAGLLEGLPGRLVRLEGAGPARARNAGIAAAHGRYVLFTDDDTEPAPAWIEAAVGFLEAHADHAGVEGRVDSPPFDPLRAVSLRNDRPGAYWTCNIGFRREVLERLGGFYVGFPFPHCEDLDLAYRALEVAPIGYADGMAIVHHPRPLTLAQLAARGRMTVSEKALFERHRWRFGRAARLPAVVFPLLQAAAYSRQTLAVAGRDPRRLIRAAALSIAYSLVVVRATLLAGG